MTINPSDTTASKKKKIAILGGGMASLVTAFKLSEASEEYEITVYQMGWRLGGKGASGRNMDPDYHYRIEEHGLHLWFGLYDNAFRLIRKCYTELNRPPDVPLATWQDAFKTGNQYLVLEEFYDGKWYHWPIEGPSNSALPGEPDATLLFPEWDHYVEFGVEIMWMIFRRSKAAQKPNGNIPLPVERWLAPILNRLAVNFSTQGINQIGRTLYAAFRLSQLLEQGHAAVLNVLGKEIQSPIRGFGMDIQRRSMRLIVLLLARFMGLYWAEVKTRLDREASRRRWIMLNVAYAHIRGVVEDNIIERGYEAINHLDYREWLKQYMVDDGGLALNSPLVWFLYDAAFSYRDGDMSKPDLEAGVALLTMTRILFTWKGAMLWRMQGSMGETVFAPLYEVLKQRGVTFKFFHRVKQLHLSPDGHAIEKITIGKQAHLWDEDAGYQPLIEVKGIPCWPSSPLYEQLVEGEALREAKENLESYRSVEVEEITLQAGENFDAVVLGIPIGAHPYICGELIKASVRWRQMVEHIKTVRTQALQLWLKPSAHQMGWCGAAMPVLTSYEVNSINTWADMTHLVEKEALPAAPGRYPLHLAYFCGPMKDDEPLPRTPHGPMVSAEELDQIGANAQVRANALRLLQEHVAHLWPKAIQHPPDGNGAPSFNWSLLIDNRTSPQEGEARLDAQYIRANIEPSERYVISARGSSRYRLAPGNSGFRNLYLAGDWTDNGFNLGNIEAATMSGMLASHAISGYPALNQIVGYAFGRASNRTNKDR